MALSDQPYLPLYVDDWMNNNKLKACSAQARGVMIAVMCLMHKAPVYGRLELFQRFAIAKRIANSEVCYDFAMSFAKMVAHFSSMTEQETSSGLRELLDVGSLVIEDGALVCKRMERDGKTSKSRSMAGKRGNEQRWGLTNDMDKNINSKNINDFCDSKTYRKSIANTIAKPIANSGNENENEFVFENNSLSFDSSFDFDVDVDVKGVDFGGVGVDVKGVDFDVDGVKGVDFRGKGIKEVSSKGTNRGKGSKEGLPPEATSSEGSKEGPPKGAMGGQGCKEVPPKGATEGQEVSSFGIEGGDVAQNPQETRQDCATFAKSGVGSSQGAPPGENALKTPLNSIGGKEPKPPPKKEPERKYGEYGWVRLTDAAYAGLVGKYGEAEVKAMVDYVDGVAERTENKAGYKRWAAVINQCAKGGWHKKGGSYGGGYGRNRFARDDELKRDLAETAAKMIAKYQAEEEGST